jgi:pSer/pThr/pTyr-binding forkhead associated (FHA) protein
MLWYLRDVDSDEVYEINDGDTFGRTEGEHTFPRAALMSRKHFKIVMQEDFPWIIDLNSRNGTFVNGKRCEPNERQLLTEDSIIAFANIRLQFRKKVVLSTSLIRYNAKKRGA